MSIDPRFAQVLNDAVETYEQRLAFVRNSGTLRTADGLRATWRDDFPTPEERQAAQETLGDPANGDPILATCSACFRSFGTATDFTSIRDHGLCQTCHLHEQHGLDGTIQYRPPTLREALGVVKPRGAEAATIRTAAQTAMREPQSP